MHAIALRLTSVLRYLVLCTESVQGVMDGESNHHGLFILTNEQQVPRQLIKNVYLPFVLLHVTSSVLPRRV
jgi:hypothetical protein